MQKQGVADIYLEPAKTPIEWWRIVLQATTTLLVAHNAGVWRLWVSEFRFAYGWPDSNDSPYDAMNA